MAAVWGCPPCRGEMRPAGNTSAEIRRTRLRTPSELGSFSANDRGRGRQGYKPWRAAFDACRKRSRHGGTERELRTFLAQRADEPRGGSDPPRGNRAEGEAGRRAPGAAGRRTAAARGGRGSTPRRGEPAARGGAAGPRRASAARRHPPRRSRKSTARRRERGAHRGDAPSAGARAAPAVDQAGQAQAEPPHHGGRRLAPLGLRLGRRSGRHQGPERQSGRDRGGERAAVRRAAGEGRCAQQADRRRQEQHRQPPGAARQRDRHRHQARAREAARAGEEGPGGGRGVPRQAEHEPTGGAGSGPAKPRAACTCQSGDPLCSCIQ